MARYVITEHVKFLKKNCERDSIIVGMVSKYMQILELLKLYMYLGGLD